MSADPASLDLRAHQRALLGLIRGLPGAAEQVPDELRHLVGSRELAVTREVVHWWTEFGLERYCLLTSTLLQCEGRFGAAVAEFHRECGVSGLVEDLGARFLAWAAARETGLAGAVVRFEWALLRAKRGESGRHTIDWPQEPYAVLSALLQGEAPPAPAAARGYRTEVGADLPGGFRVVETG